MSRQGRKGITKEKLGELVIPEFFLRRRENSRKKHILPKEIIFLDRLFD